MTEKDALIEELNALADGQLEKNRIAELQKIIQSNPQISITYTSIVNVKLAVNQLPAETHPELLAILHGRLGEIDRTRRADQFVTRYAWGLCGFVLLTIVGAGTYARMHGSTVGLSDVPGYSAGMVSSSFESAPQGIGNWLKRLIVGSPAKQAAPLKVLKEDVGSISGVPAARVILGDPNDPYTLFIIHSDGPIRGVQPIDGSTQVQYWSGHVGPWNCLNWKQGEYQLILLGNHDQNNLEGVAGSIHVR